MSEVICSSDSSNCHHHFHAEDQKYLAEKETTHLREELKAGESQNSNSAVNDNNLLGAQDAQHPSSKMDHGFRRIVRNFTPS